MDQLIQGFRGTGIPATRLRGHKLRGHRFHPHYSEITLRYPTGQTHGARREHGAYKYMRIYLWAVLTIHVFWVWDLMWRDKTGGEWIW